MLSRTNPFLLVLVAACSPVTNRVEGDFAGECTSGADEDRDGLFDCEDPDCVTSAVCVALADTDILDTTPGDSDGDDTDDTDVLPVELSWNTAAWANGWEDFVGCGSGSVELVAETLRWGGAVKLYMTQTDNYGDFIAWEESHTLEETSASPQNGPRGFSVFGRTLATDAGLDQRSDESTLWTCTNARPTMKPSSANFEVAFALAVWAPGDSTNAAPSDCIYFGHNPADLVNDGYTGGTGSSGSGRTLPDWVSPSACTLVP